MRLSKKLPPLLVGLGIVAAIVYAFLPKPVAVEVATVTRGLLRVTVDEDGRTRIKERYVVSSPLAGRLMRVELQAGDAVEAGKTLLACLEPNEPQLLDPRERAQAAARVKAAEATRQQAIPLLERARANYDFAKMELDRVRRLRESGAASPQELDSAEQKERAAAGELKAAQFAVQIAEFELELARAALARASQESPGETDAWRLNIYSPIAGRVLRVFQESATVVSAGTRLLELGDPADLEIEIDVLSTDAVKIRPGARIIVEHWGGERPLEARVRLIEPAGFIKISALGVEEQRVWVIADFVDPPEHRRTLGDAYRVEARIVIWEGENVLQVPTGALFRQGERWAVFVAARGRAHLRPVTIGKKNSLAAELIEGLADGETVIIHPSDKVRSGKNIRRRS